MGNREDLLRGARQCLEERGWANTTVRDIAAAAGGISHAAIGYHFGSREALLTAALVQTAEERFGKFRAALAPTADADAVTKFRASWEQFAESFESQRGVWLSHFEAVIHAQHSEQLRKLLTDNQAAGRHAGAAWLTGADEQALDEATARSIGSVYVALVAGMTWQYLVDPESAPGPTDIVNGMRAIGALLGEGSAE